jgi:hypothetical protein
MGTGIDPTAILQGFIASGPLGLAAAVFLYLYLRSDQRNQALTDKLLEVSVDTVSALKDVTTAVNAAIRGRNGGQ